MLEIKNLSKVYRSKTGESVRALDNVSISFPESGMVFILGKSGSGKSTLLNIMGGLDSYDSGEFVIKGKSSKDFAGSDFDAYRNTFIGFIFQEYNVLDDFTVGANIALALELQGKKATTEKINEILSQVDLLNFAKRKPNELSGGQKQRVAIARALVKEPQIIMADEPTGALDSNTGKQIFDSLKALSREKLVLIVSHDRDFAERYADRIIELADGHIISDVTKHEHESERLSDGIDKIGGRILRIKGGYRLTTADLQMINDYLANNGEDVLLSGDRRVNDELRSAAGISEKGSTSVFEGTDVEKDYQLKKYEKADSRFIRSRLPMKNALRMGTSGLKHKKFRLVMTVLLSLIAFGLFGFADTMAAYNKNVAAVESLMDSHVRNASVTVGVRRTSQYGDEDPYISYDSARMNDDDLAWLSAETGLEFVPVFTGSDPYGYGGGFSLTGQMQSYSSNTVYSAKIHGLVSLTPEQIATTGFSMTGRLPECEGEIAITEHLFRQFNEYGFQNASHKESIKAGSVVKDGSGANSIIGKHITLASDAFNYMGGGKEYSYEIVGVVDTAFDYDRYQAFLPEDETEQQIPMPEEDGNMLTDMVLQMEIQSELNYGFHGLGFMNRADIETLSKLVAPSYQQIGTYMNGWRAEIYISLSTVEEGSKESGMLQDLRFNQVADSSALSKLTVKWLDNNPRTQLAANEVVIPAHIVENMIPQEAKINVDTAAIANEATRLYGADAWGATDTNRNFFERLEQAALLGYIDEQLQDEDVVNAVIEYVNVYRGESISTAAEARDFWVRHWIDERQHEAPVYNYSEALKNYWEVTEGMREDILPFLLTSYGLELPEGVTPDQVDLLYATLRDTGESSNECSLSRYQVEDMLRRIYSEVDVTEHQLWKNDDFISMMLNHEHYGITQQNWNEMQEPDRINCILQFYQHYYLNDHAYGYNENAYGEYSGKDFNAMAKDVFARMSGYSMEEILSSLQFERFEYDYQLGQETSLGTYDFKIVGVYEMQGNYYYGDILISDTVLADYRTWQTENQDGNVYIEEIAPHDDGIWAFALSPMPRDQETVRRLVELSYDETQDLKFVLQNPIMDTLDTFNEFIELGSMIFLYVGIGFAVFSALLLMNFIATSISYKKREIGVLRAVGARSSDVFKIFFSEALVIALINFVMATAAVIAAITVTNNLMRANGITVTLLTYGVRQFIIMLLVSVGVALLASFLPVYNIARRKPVDAIKDR